MEDKKISILGINGSPHKDGGTVQMLNEALEGAKKHGAEVKLINLFDYNMKLYHGDYDKKPCEESLRLFKEMEKYDGYIFATPVHWLAPSSLMKIFLDNMTYLEVEDFQMEGKVFGVLAHCLEDGAFQAATYLASVFGHMGMVCPPYAAVLRNKNLKTDEDTDYMNKDSALLGKNVVIMVEMLKKEKPVWDYD